MDGSSFRVDSYELHPIDDSIAGDAAVSAEIEQFKKVVTAAVFASRGYAVDQPLVVVSEDVPNTFTDIVAGTPLANFVTDADRAATGADMVLTANGMVRAGFTKGKSGVQTVYDVFAATPLGQGVLDETAGSALVTAYLTGREIKHMLRPPGSSWSSPGWVFLVSVYILVTHLTGPRPAARSQVLPPRDEPES